jgi:hypothetical protein
MVEFFAQAGIPFIVQKYSWPCQIDTINCWTKIEYVLTIKKVLFVSYCTHARALFTLSAVARALLLTYS